ncbi:MAG: dockerin type I repeat-containing protein, partial [Anaerolineales bacterium]
MDHLRSARVGIVTLAAWLTLLGAGPPAHGQCVFTRGDVNGTGVVDLNDAVDILAFIFLGETVPLCPEVADVNDNGIVELSDYTYMARWILDAGPPPPAPYPDKGVDPTPGTTVPAEPDPRFTFKIGESIGFASNTGLKIPLFLSSEVELLAFQMVFEYDGSIVRIDEMLPDETALKEADAEYIIHQAFNRPGVTHGGYSALIDFATPISFRTLPAGQDQLVGNIVVSLSLIADPGETPLRFVDKVIFPDEDPPEKLVPVENLVMAAAGVFRPNFVDGKVIIRKAFIRGDSNQDKRTDISDAVHILDYIFKGGPPPKCFDASDTNNDSRLDISDPIFWLNYLFRGGPQPSSPFPVPGVDPDHDSLDCAQGL